MIDIFENMNFGDHFFTMNGTEGIYWGKSVAFGFPLIGSEYPYQVIFPNGMGMYNSEGKFCTDDAGYNVDIRAMLIDEMNKQYTRERDARDRGIVLKFLEENKDLPIDYTNVESVLNIASKTIGIEIDPEAYKRYNKDDKNVGSKR